MSALPGCTSYQSMRLHYAVVNIDEPNPQVKFYRVTLRGYSSNVKANMNTGYYDANTLRYLYGDVQRDSGSGSATGAGLTALASPSSTLKNNIPPGQVVVQFDPATRTWSQVPSTSLFTMIYGADSQALSDAIKAYAQSGKTGDTMGALFARATGGDSFDQAVTAEQQQQTMALSAKKIDSAISTLVASLTNSIAKANPPAPAPTPTPAPIPIPTPGTGTNAVALPPTNSPPNTGTASTAAQPMTPLAAAPAPAPLPLPSPDQFDQQLLTVVQQAITLLGSGTTLSTANSAEGFSQALQVYQLLNQNPTK